MIKVLKPGFYTSIQDMGRFGFQQYGVPFSGAMDRYAYKISNVLLGNSENASVLEITMIGPELLFNESTLICVSGALMNAVINKVPISNNQLVEIKKGSILHFGKAELGFRSYLAVKGGFQMETVMGSQSMYQDITKKFRLKQGDELAVNYTDYNRVFNRHAFLKVDTSYFDDPIIEVSKGPEFELLNESERQILLTSIFKISKNNNRMAYQLEEPLENDLISILTSLVMPGTVQLTPSGQMIILMRDCQTTGGYPRILQLTERSINNLAQKFAGQPISFKLID